MKGQNWRESTQSGVLLLAGIVLLFIIPLSLLESSSASATDFSLGPIFSHPGGFYEDDFRLRIDGPQGAKIMFTLDGRIPTETTGAMYTQPILVSRETAVTVVRARAFSPDGEPGPTVTTSYFIDVESTLPLLSLVADPDDLFSPQTGIYANPTERGREWERPANITYLETDRATGFQAPVGVRIGGASSRLYDKKSWRLYFRQEYGHNRLDYPLFDDELTSFKRLVIHNGGQDADSPLGTLLRAHLFSDLAEEMGLTVSQTQPVLLFINGHAEGIYLMRNRVDDWFLADKYGFQILPEAEAEARWQRLNQFAGSHDLNDSDNYAYVATQVNMAGFIDYHILQIYAANTDWIYTNMRKFQPSGQGGRLQWIVWDMDWAFGLSPRGGPDFDMMAWFEMNERPGFSDNSHLIRKLWQNPDFQHAFLTRTDELLTTTLAGEKVAAQVDMLATELRPDIGYENNRWPGPGDWEANVAFMRDFARQRPSHMRQHLINYFEQTS